MTTLAVAAPIPQGDSQVSLIDKYKVKVGLQYRIMYNYSNIPLSGVTTAVNTKNYDFFRQRMRFNIDVQPADNVGGFLQLEYRGGWGGSSPANSDPRGVGLTLNAFNRLDARGVRYGYIYYTPSDQSYLAAGVIPISDRLGDTLFSADWDFNVGGITYNGKRSGFDYRLAYVRIIDGVASTDKDIIGKNSNIYIADLDYSARKTVKLGAHIYYLHASENLGTASGLPGKVSQGWYALSGSVDINKTNINGFICFNKGDYGTTDNSGLALKAEAIIPLGSPTVKLLAVYSTGDKEGITPDDQFRTIQGIFGTEGYWAYTHLFTPNGPSDVNDLGVGIDNGGRGLTSVQAKIEMPFMDKFSGELSGGWFQATEDNAAGEKDMGTEVGTMITYAVAEKLNLQVGLAYASLGDYYKVGSQAPDNLHEVFSRFQLQF